MLDIPWLGSGEGTASSASLKAALSEQSTYYKPYGEYLLLGEGRELQGWASQGQTLSLPSSSCRFLRLDGLKPHVFQLLHYSEQAVGGSFKDL